MALQVAVGSPLAEALQTVVQPKLVEVGWSTSGVDDSALSEYIILMLVNGKTQDQIASELSQDLLGLGPEDRAAVDFSQWLFEQLERLHRELDGDGSALPSGQNGAAHLPSGQFEASGVPQISQQAMGDTSMASGTDVSQLMYVNTPSRGCISMISAHFHLDLRHQSL